MPKRLDDGVGLGISYMSTVYFDSIDSPEKTNGTALNYRGRETAGRKQTGENKRDSSELSRQRNGGSRRLFIRDIRRQLHSTRLNSKGSRYNHIRSPQGRCERFPSTR